MSSRTVGLLVASLLGLLAPLVAANAQQPSAVARVGSLRPAPPSPEVTRVLVELAAKHRLPAIMPFPLFAEDGGLMACGPGLIDLYRQGGAMVGKILKGARPRDLAAERPNRFLLVVNTKTAKALGLTIPPSILIRADRVIE
jgi:ABC-type uncharacterized transport system substrate-binding protein